jgi:hypothetical protein
MGWLGGEGEGDFKSTVGNYYIYGRKLYLR